MIPRKLQVAAIDRANNRNDYYILDGEQLTGPLSSMKAAAQVDRMVGDGKHPKVLICMEDYQE